MRRFRHPLMALMAVFAMAISMAGVFAQSPVASSGKTPSVLQKKINQSSGELDSIRGQIKQQQARIKGLDDQEAQVKRDNLAIVDEIDLIQQFLGEMDQRERLLTQQGQELTKDLERAKRVHDQGRQALARNLRAMYMGGNQKEMEMILTAESFSSFVTRMKYEALLARLGAGLVDQIRADASLIQSQQKQLEVSRAEIHLGREEAGLQAARLEELMAEHVAALRELETERKGIKNRLLELSMNEQRLSYVLEDLEQQRQQKAALKSTAPEGPVDNGTLLELAGQLEWPVRGEVLRGFGRSVHPKFKTVTLNNGLNIEAFVGAPVAAVGKGVVEYSDVLPGFGRCVILDHDAGYYTLYAHLDRAFVAKGEEIAMGQVIAEVGRPAPGEQAQLYFEVRHGKTPLDPNDWLRPR